MKTRTFLFPALGLALLIFILSGLWSRWVDEPLLGPLREANTAYLEANRESALKSFLVLSAMKSGLSIVEGSTVGVSLGASLQIEAGDVVQSAYDIVNIAWHTVMAGMVALTLLQWFQESAVTLQTPMAVFTLALWILLPFRSGRLRPLFQLSLLLWVAFALCLPLALRGAEALSSRITADTRAEAAEGFRSSRAELFPDAQPRPAPGVRGQIDQWRGMMDDLGDRLVDRLDQLVSWTVRLVAAYLLDCILFPLLCFLLPLALVRQLLRHQRDRTRDRQLGGEIARSFQDAEDRTRT